MLKYGVIGYGYWGPNLVRSFSRGRDCRVVMVAELDSGRIAQAKDAYPGLEVTNDPYAVISRADIDVVAIATPVFTHYDLARAALLAGKHIFVEKPFTARSAEAEELLNLAAQRNLQIFVDHTFIYTGAVRKIKQVIESGDLGRVLYYDAVRINLGLFQSDVNVLWDLAVHDIAILDYILPEKPSAVSAVAFNPLGTQAASIGYMTLYYQSSTVGHVHASWLSPVKLRHTLIGGTKRMILYNDLEPSEKVRIYDKGVEVARTAEEEYRLKVGYRSGDMWAPQLDTAEALSVAVVHANESILSGKPAITSGQVGYRVVRILEAADESALEGGRIVRLNP